MHEAVIHIGTEKTGSTAIQNYLWKNHLQLAKQNIYFPFKSCGLISNHRLALYAREKMDPLLFRMGRRVNGKECETPQDFANWKSTFAKEHAEAICQIQGSSQQSLVVYSSEHFHSRVHTEQEVKFLQKYLSKFYDRIRILMYVRRQDQLVLSSHNTAVQGGHTKAFDFSTVVKEGLYFDYLKLAERWASGFGKENLKAIVFEREKLKDHNVVKDFESQIGANNELASAGGFKYERSNERLSYSALAALIEFNLADKSDELLMGLTKESIRQKLIKELHNVTDSLGEVLPTRDAALNFYEYFVDNNEQFAQNWLENDGFNTDFSKYPLTAGALPEVDSREILRTALSHCLKEKAA